MHNSDLKSLKFVERHWRSRYLTQQKRLREEQQFEQEYLTNTPLLANNHQAYTNSNPYQESDPQNTAVGIDVAVSTETLEADITPRKTNDVKDLKAAITHYVKQSRRVEQATEQYRVSQDDSLPKPGLLRTYLANTMYKQSKHRDRQHQDKPLQPRQFYRNDDRQTPH